MDNQYYCYCMAWANHTAKSFEDEVVGAANTALHRYEGYKEEKFEKKVKIHSIEFNSLFEEHRKKFTDNAKGIQKALGGLANINVPSIIGKLADFESNLGEDKFANTHILDFVLYMTIVGQQVRGKAVESSIRLNCRYD